MEAYNWVHKNDICVFLNGNRYGTTCKNSRGVLNILKYYAIRKFLDIDVTRSTFFKENLAMYSNWPTFPQLFIKGQFMGGYADVKAKHDSGKLEEILIHNDIIEKVDE